jgi:hypothetical protein
MQARADGDDDIRLSRHALADDEPMMPIGPTCAGWSWVTAPLPAMVSAIGMPRFMAKSATAFSASE